LIRVYTASKLTDAPLWRSLEKDWPHVIFHARWLRHIDVGTPDTPKLAASYWLEDEQDVVSADALIVYSESNTPLRGALVEIGMAIAFGVSVIVVGDNPAFGTWQYHPGVHRVPDLKAASELLLRWDIANSTHQAVTSPNGQTITYNTEVVLD
jgi:hypothetical protein